MPFTEEYNGDGELLLQPVSKPRKQRYNPVRIFVLSTFFIFVYFSGFATHTLMAGLSNSIRKQRLDNIGALVDPVSMKQNHIELTNQTHLVGSQRNYELAKFIAGKFREYKFDNIELKNYTVRFPFPDPEKPNSVNLFDSVTGELKHTCREKEVPLTEFEKNTPTMVLFNGFSKTGTVKAPYVYVNLASLADFKLLEKYNITVENKIVLARYGTVFRGNQAANAARAGASAIVFFKDLAKPEIKDRYPYTEWAPSSSGARGTMSVLNGDTESLGWPSVPGGFKKHSNLSANIIGQPITGDDAKILLKALPANPNFTLPESWKIGLLEEEFSVGTGREEGPLLEVTVNSKVKLVNITNVIGTIRGDVEPDRWVLHGVHRDSWTYGGTDPNSGTTVMLEVGRILSYYLKRGWRPRRTIKLCSWDGEEWGLFGSLEWVEEHRKLLEHNAVVYINTDVAVGGSCTFVGATGSPLFQSIANKIISKVNKEQFGYGFPFHYYLSGSGSDMFGFANYAGVSNLDVECYGNNDLYHTLYDNRHVFDLVDKDYRNMSSVANVLAQLVVGISEPAILPINITDYTTSIRKWWRDLKPKLTIVSDKLGVSDKAGIIDEMVEELHYTATTFDSDIYSKTSDKNTQLYIRQLNDKLMYFERAFLVDEQIPGTDFYSRNILSSPSKDNIYAGSGFPALQYIIGQGAEANKSMLLFEIERIRWAFHSAVETLKL